MMDVSDRALRVATTIGHHTWVDSTRDVSRLLVHVVRAEEQGEQELAAGIPSAHPDPCATCVEAREYARILAAALDGFDRSHPR